MSKIIYWVDDGKGADPVTYCTHDEIPGIKKLHPNWTFHLIGGDYCQHSTPRPWPNGITPQPGICYECRKPIKISS